MVQWLIVDTIFPQTNWDQVCETFDDMNLREELQRGIYAYGYVCVCVFSISGTPWEGPGVPHNLLMHDHRGGSCNNPLSQFPLTVTDKGYDVMVSSSSPGLRNHRPFNRGQ